MRQPFPSGLSSEPQQASALRAVLGCTFSRGGGGRPADLRQSMKGPKLRGPPSAEVGPSALCRRAVRIRRRGGAGLRATDHCASASAGPEPWASAIVATSTSHRAETMNPVLAVDHWVAHADGRMFAREWIPAESIGAPILMLHDSLGCVELWRGFPQLLSASTSRRVIAYDRLGFGRSDALEHPLSPNFIADEAILCLPTVRRHFGIERFVALGHSVGGGMAIEAAAREYGSCDGLVTIAAQAFVETRTLDGIRAAKTQFQDPAERARLSKYHGVKSGWVLDAWIGRWLDPGFAGWTLKEVLPRVTCPVLAIHGENDEFGSTLHADLIGELAGRGPASIEVLPSCGHVPHREDPERVSALISAFLAGTLLP